MATELTDEQIAELKRLNSCCVLIRGKLKAAPYGGWLHGIWCHDGGFPMLLARTCFAPASEENADYIAASVNAIPSLLAEREQMRERIAELEQALTGRTVSCAGCNRLAELEPLAAIGRAAVRKYECQCEFEDDLSCCGELYDALDSLIAAYKDGYEVRPDGLGQNDPMGGRAE